MQAAPAALSRPPASRRRGCTCIGRAALARSVCPSIDWASPSHGRDGYDMSRSFLGSSRVMAWMQQSDFGAFGNCRRQLGKEERPYSGYRMIQSSATNPLISMGSCGARLNGNQAPLSTQAAAAPAPLSSPLPSTELDTPHWLAPYVPPMDRASRHHRLQLYQTCRMAGHRPSASSGFPE